MHHILTFCRHLQVICARQKIYIKLIEYQLKSLFLLNSNKSMRNNFIIVFLIFFSLFSKITDSSSLVNDMKSPMNETMIYAFSI